MLQSASIYKNTFRRIFLVTGKDTGGNSINNKDYYVGLLKFSHNSDSIKLLLNVHFSLFVHFLEKGRRMCVACNPFCGHCRPPKKRVATCAQCGTVNRCDIFIQYPPVTRNCETCGADITAEATPPTKYCKNTKRLCANPCHYNTIDPDPRVKRICWYNSPPPQPKETIQKNPTRKAESI